ncbi:polysaccharide deacetylase family protein [Aestuariibacter halophilus]|uniref:Polysaccharide deacetylase family protein n=1 Tax=Fluctibacter halophilus TaxID=226011 RepID=A0ABS8G7Y2_9ALTE|nr:polysaccharide deacetylase family protein [Aestuariibacter halophilus]MCC2615331.1 polysaccharide deacetylase family protein [Aestuariibacter halophilus]
MAARYWRILWAIAALLAAGVTLAKPWPGDAQAAVVLGYDDALPSQLYTAVGQLNDVNIKATFYLTLTTVDASGTWQQWRDVAQQGHALGNHTFSHPCRGDRAGRGWVSAEQDLSRWSAQQLLADIERAQQQLNQLAPASERSFTPPCGDHLVGGKNYWAMLPADISVMRVPYDTKLPPVSPGITVIPTWFPVDVSAQTLINFTEKAARDGGIASVSFHGIGGDHLSVDSAAHRQFLDYLAANRNRYWITTTVALARHLKTVQSQ